MPHSSRTLIGQGQAPRRVHVRDEQHVGALAVQGEPVRDLLAQDRRRKGTERFAKLDLQVQHRLHLGRSRVGDNRAAAERARTELHASLQQADHLLVGQQRGDLVGEPRGRDASGHVPVPFHECLDLRLRESRAEKRAAHAVGIAGHATGRRAGTAVPMFPRLQDWCAACRGVDATAPAPRPATRQRRRPPAAPRSARTALRAGCGRSPRS